MTNITVSCLKGKMTVIGAFQGRQEDYGNVYSNPILIIYIIRVYVT